MIEAGEVVLLPRNDTLGLGARVIDVLDREIELVLVPFGIAAELTAAIGQTTSDEIPAFSSNGIATKRIVAWRPGFARSR